MQALSAAQKVGPGAVTRRACARQMGRVHLPALRVLDLREASFARQRLLPAEISGWELGWLAPAPLAAGCPRLEDMAYTRHAGVAHGTALGAALPTSLRRLTVQVPPWAARAAARARGTRSRAAAGCAPLRAGGGALCVASGSSVRRRSGAAPGDADRPAAGRRAGVLRRARAP